MSTLNFLFLIGETIVGGDALRVASVPTLGRGPLVKVKLLLLPFQCGTSLSQSRGVLQPHPWVLVFSQWCPVHR